jgi:hypothetical protein
MKLIEGYFEMVKELKEGNKKENDFLRKMKPDEYKYTKAKIIPDEVWRSNRFAVQVFYESVTRLSVVRTMINKSGEWKDGITWDELQSIKNQCGFKNKVAVEVYPPDSEVMNVSNVRHLFVLNETPEYMWRNE